MELDHKKVEKIFATCILTVFLGQIYLNPFSSGFRFSFSVTALSLMLLYFKDISINLATTMVGLFMFIFRSFVYIAGSTDATFAQAFEVHYPVVLFYVFFGILFDILHIREKLNKMEIFLLSLWFCDSMANIIEIALRQEVIEHPFESVILTIILTGALRSIVTLLIYSLSVYYMQRFERERKENKYRELILFISSLKTELFFLRKSITDIEDAMKRSYHLYEKLRETEQKDAALLVAKDIHEIKKDYMRVVAGLEKTLSEEHGNLSMDIKDIFAIINDNTKKLIASKDKNIILRFKYKHNFQTKEFYQLISILNNLIINAIESIDEVGIITITEEIEKTNCVFRVIDNGSGINREELEYIFEPGFSTKFNPTTGEMSTGIGLTHVKHILENHFQGEISVSSKKDAKTVFIIKIPTTKIMNRKW